jgi:hypothetical protein
MQQSAYQIDRQYSETFAVPLNDSAYFVGVGSSVDVFELTNDGAVFLDSKNLGTSNAFHSSTIGHNGGLYIAGPFDHSWSSPNFLGTDVGVWTLNASGENSFTQFPELQEYDWDTSIDAVGDTILISWRNGFELVYRLINAEDESYSDITIAANEGGAQTLQNPVSGLMDEETAYFVYEDLKSGSIISTILSLDGSSKKTIELFDDSRDSAHVDGVDSAEQDGRVAAAYQANDTEALGDSAGSDIVVTIFNQNSKELSFRANQAFIGDQRAPKVAFTDSGNVLVAYTDVSKAETNLELYSEQGAFLSGETLESSTTYGSGFSRLDDGALLFAYTDYTAGGAAVLKLKDNGSALLAEPVVSSEEPDLDEEAPSIASPDAIGRITENSGANQVVYIAEADDSSNVDFSLKSDNSDDSDSFTIDGSTGKVTLTEDPDFETKSSYNFTVVATDAEGNEAEQPIGLDVRDQLDGLLTARTGEVLSGMDVSVIDVPEGESGFYIRPVSLGKVSEVELVLKASQPVESLDFEIRDDNALGSFEPAAILDDWAVTRNTETPNHTKVAAFAPPGAGVELSGGEELVLGTLSTTSRTAAADISMTLDRLEVNESRLASVDIATTRSESDESGRYSFSVTSSDTMHLSASGAYADDTGQISAADALGALRLAVGLEDTSEPFDYIAADFDRDGRVTSQDAYEILKRAVDLSTALEANWVFTPSDADLSEIDRKNVVYPETIEVDHSHQNMGVDLVGTLLGDVSVAVDSIYTT